MAASISFEVNRELHRERPSTLGQYVSIPGVAALGSAALLYAYSVCVSRKAQELSRAEPISQLADLTKVAHLLPMLVAIRGRVNSYYAKKCELSEKHAVIHELMEEEIWRKQRAEGRTIYEPFETRKGFEECEWFVDDGSGLRVKVENALQAGHLRSAMETKTEFSPEDLANKSVGRVLMEKAWQMTKTGVRKTERYLPVGTVVTCVGELAPNQIRTPVSSTPAGTVSLPPKGTFTTSPPFHFSTPSSSNPHTRSSNHSTTNMPSSSNHSTTNMPSSSSSSSNPLSSSSMPISSNNSSSGPSGRSLRAFTTASGEAHLGPSTSASNSSTHTKPGAPGSEPPGASVTTSAAHSDHGAAQHSTAGGGPQGLSALFPARPERDQSGSDQASTSGRGAGEEGLAYVMRKPVVGPSYITTLSAEQLVATLTSTARRCRWAAYALGAVGAFLVARKAVMRVMQRLHEHRVRARVLQAENARRTRLAEAQKARSDANGWTDTGGSDLSVACHLDASQDGYQDGYDGDREPNTCVICLENAVGTVFTPCGHLCCCVGCGLATSLDKCPVCRQRGRAIRVFRP